MLVSRAFETAQEHQHEFVKNIHGLGRDGGLGLVCNRPQFYRRLFWNRFVDCIDDGIFADRVEREYLGCSLDRAWA